MPGGSELIPLQWQPVPGCRDTLIYPLIRKVDAISCNSYIVQTPDAIILIDPGGLPDQAAHLASVVRATRTEKDRPLIVMLTHIHVDHYVAALPIPIFTDPDAAIIAVQELGARALESADRTLTLADLMELEITPVRVDLHLFSKAGASITRTYANGTTVTVVREEPESGLEHERIAIGSRSSIEVYHTPGHSPDSCCIRIGGLLFVGDLLFAACPGLAGIAGWDQGHLVRSLAGVQALLQKRDITAICPGHGRPLMVDECARMLEAVQKDTRLLTGIAEFTHDRSRETAAFAEDCMEQVNELFTVMAGRLLYVSFVMDELGESDTAAGLERLIRADVVDDLLESFSAFARESRSARQAPLHLALKGGQVIGKLQRSFDQGQLAKIIDPTLVQRAERLLGDYSTMLRGFSPPRDIAVHDLRNLLRTCIAGHSARPGSDDDILASVDDDAAFRQLLLSRIGMPPLLADITVTADIGAEPLTVPVDRERFTDLVTYLLEDLVGAGAVAITVRTRRDDDAIVVTISGEWCGEPPTDGGTPRRFLSWLCERAGGTLEVSGAGCPSQQCMIRFTPAI